MNKEIKAIVFDVGGVLYEESMIPAYKQLSKIFNFDLKEFERVKAKYYDLAHTGKISAYKYPYALADELKIKDKKRFVTLWFKSGKKLLQPNKKVIKLLIKLRKDYDIATLTNITKIHDKIRKQKGIYKNFDLVLVSCREGIKKPDLAFYRLLIKRLSLHPRQIVFIDDQEKYLKPAKNLGIRTIAFKNNAQLIKDLRKQGVKT
ncbi:hypothetical protein A3K73_04155 [Candidatus Pacearchaeota archaeon RBG_13_36_9]|nr:MAG: hypothetical protein A3K73_04155 [Candidatus Pacearchaeota archaeon RBG_13_36_9]